MADLSDRFLEAFSQVEEVLRRLTGGSKRDSFGHLVKAGQRQFASVRAVADDLIEYADLRNAIVHERGGGYVIAEPHPETVSRLERLLERIANPPKVDAFVGPEIVSCAKDDPIGDAARKMWAGSYSQLPVVADDQVEALLTTNTIARWIANRFSPDMDLLEEETVESVLHFQEEFEKWVSVSRSHLVAELLETFQAQSVEGNRLVAAVVTHSGRTSEKPLGIITEADLPRLYASVDA